MVVRELVALLGVKADSGSFKRASGQLDGLVTVAKKAAGLFAGYLSFSFLKNTVKATAEFADNLDEMSQRTGTSIETLQRLKYIAKQTGLEFGMMEFALKRLQVAQSKGKDAFAKLGVSAKRADGHLKSVEEILPELAGGIASITDPAMRTKIAVDLFGRTGTRMLPMLLKGKEGIAAFLKEADEYGLVIGGDAIKAAGGFNDRLKTTDDLVDNLKKTIGLTLIPVLDKLVKKFLAWWKVNKDWVKADIKKVFEELGKVIDVVAFTVGKISDLFRTFWANSGNLEKALLGVAGAVVVLKTGLISMQTLPIFALLTTLFLLIEDFMYFKAGKKSFIGKVMGEGSDYAQWLRVWDGLFMSIAEGAVKIDEFFDGVDAACVRFRNSADQFIKDIPSRIAAGFQKAKQLILDVVDELQLLFFGFVDKVVGGILGIPRAIANAFGLIKLPSWMQTIIDWSERKREDLKIVDNVKDVRNAEENKYKNSNEWKGWDAVSLYAQGGASLAQGNPLDRAGPIPSAKSVTTTYAPVTTLNVKVEAVQGMNEKQLADKMGKAAKKAIDDSHREAFYNLKPQSAAR